MPTIVASAKTPLTRRDAARLARLPPDIRPAKSTPLRTALQLSRQMGATGMKPRPDSVHLRNAPSGRAVLTTEAMPTFLDPTPVLSTMRYLTAAYALVATV